MSQNSSQRPVRKKVHLWFRRATAFAVIGITGFAAYMVGSQSSRDQPSATRSPIVAVPQTLNFGETWETDSFRWHLKFENVSKDTALLNDVRSGCACVKIESEEGIVLERGERITIPVELDLRQLRMFERGEYRSVNLSFIGQVGHAGDAPSKYRWRLRGRVRRAFEIEPPYYRVGEKLVAGGKGSALEFRLRPFVPIVEITLKQTPPGWSAELQKQPTDYLLRVQPRKKESGRFFDVFELQAKGAGGRVLSDQQATVEGIVTNLIGVFPNDTDLGALPIGTAGTTSIWVCHREDLPIKNVKVIEVDVQTKVLGVHQHGNSWRIDMERSIASPGPGTATGAIRIGKGEGSITLPFRMRWYGVLNSEPQGRSRGVVTR